MRQYVIAIVAGVLFVTGLLAATERSDRSTGTAARPGRAPVRVQLKGWGYLPIVAAQQFRRASQSWSPDPRVQARLDSAVEDPVAYMLFVEEAPLRDPVKEVSTYAACFKYVHSSRRRSAR
jgi:hypothetical protein